MNRNIHKQIHKSTFVDYSETVWVYLKNGNDLGANYHPYHKTGQTVTTDNPLPVKAIVSQRVPWALQSKEVGDFLTGVISIIIEKKDVNLFKYAEKIEYDDYEYSVYNKALGNRVSIERRAFDFYRVILYKKGN